MPDTDHVTPQDVDPFPGGRESDDGGSDAPAAPAGTGAEARPGTFDEPDPLPLDRPDNDPIDEGAALGEASGPLDANYNADDYTAPGHEHGG